MSQPVSETTTTVVVGNGPAALILSYILHGHIPYYSGGHHDELLDRKLANSPNLLHITSDLYTHFTSSLKYSSKGLPVDILLDTLLRPHGDGDIGSSSCVKWRYEPENAVQHIILGSASHPGGQWANNPVEASSDIGTLSYAEQLSLPGYTFADHWLAMKKVHLPEFLRPSRHDVAEYFGAYPAAVGIQDSIRSSSEVANVSRTSTGFYIASHDIYCRHLVLASGIFSINQPPPPFLRPLADLPTSAEGPLLIIGSGLTAADIIISTPPNRKIIHLFNWDPENRPSPLRSCHHQAYPEYAAVYRHMKRAALSFQNPQTRPKPIKTTKSNMSQIPYFAERDWTASYEGIPNARIIFVDPAIATPSTSHESPVQGTTPVHIGRSASGEKITRQISSFRYATGRRGSLAYLSKPLLHEVMPQEQPLLHAQTNPDALLAPPSAPPSISSRRSSVELDFADIERTELISGRTLRGKIEDGAGDMEVARDVYAIGSLTGDTLVRLAFGGCVVVAGRIMGCADENAHVGLGSDGKTGPPVGYAAEDEPTSSGARRPLFVPTLNRILSHPGPTSPKDMGSLADHAGGVVTRDTGTASTFAPKVNGVAQPLPSAPVHGHPDLNRRKLSEKGEKDKKKSRCMVF